MAFPVVQIVTGTQFATNTTSHDVNMPATVASGDLLLTFVCSSRSTDNPHSYTTPSGWTQVFQEINAGNSLARVTFGAWARVAVGNEDGQTFDWVSDHAVAACAEV